MKFYNISQMKRGWIIGKFKPVVEEWNKGEFAVKKFKKGSKVSFCSELDETLILAILQGEVQINGEDVKEGKIVRVKQGEALIMQMLHKSTILQIVFFDIDKNDNSDDYLESFLQAHRKNYKHEDFDNKSTPIRFKDITAVVQGPIDEFWTPTCIKSIRRFLPESEIILSTWIGDKYADLDYDLLVENEDPGCVKNGVFNDYDSDFVNNINRQLLSTKNGLSRVRTEYAFKIRTDMVVTTNDFLSYFNRYSFSENHFRIFNHKVLISELFTVESHEVFVNGIYRSFPVPFHPSDWFYFGKTNDLRIFFDRTALMESGKMGHFGDYAHPERKLEYKCSWNMQFPPEQYLAISALKNNGFDISMSDWTDWNDEYIEQSRDFILNNFIVLSYANHGIFLPKYKNKILANSGLGEYRMKGLFTQQEYERAYKEKYGSLDD